MSSVVVVGGGPFGVSAALSLRQRGYDVTLVEAVTCPSPLAASYDISKVVRCDYGGDPLYTRLGLVSLDRWGELEKHWNASYQRRVFENCGMAFLCTQPLEKADFEYRAYKLLRERCGLRRIDAESVSRSFPMWRSEPVVDGYFNPADGWARSSLAVDSLARDAEARGVRVRTNTPIDAVLYESDGAGLPYTRAAGVVTRSGERIRADHVVVAAGAWTTKLVPHATSMMESCAQPVVLFKQPAEQCADFEQDRFPVWGYNISDTGFYGFPAEAGVVKVANHGKGLENAPLRDFGADRPVPVAAVQQRFVDFTSKVWNVRQPLQVESARVCWYCDTNNGDFLIDRVPSKSRITVAAGGSGHAFKFMPVLGDIIADVVESGTVEKRFTFAGHRTFNDRIDFRASEFDVLRSSM